MDPNVHVTSRNQNRTPPPPVFSLYKTTRVLRKIIPIAIRFSSFYLMDQQHLDDDEAKHWLPSYMFLSEAIPSRYTANSHYLSSNMDHHLPALLHRPSAPEATPCSQVLSCFLFAFLSLSLSLSLSVCLSSVD